MPLVSLPFAVTTAWLLAGARTLALTAPADIPLELIPGDPRPTVQAHVNERPTNVVLDVGGWSRVGRLAAIRLGLDVHGDRTSFDLAVGPLTLTEMRAEVVPGEDVVLGLATLDEGSMTLSASEGQWTMRRASSIDGAAPWPVVDGRRQGDRLGLTGAIDTAARNSQAVLPDAEWHHGTRGAWRNDGGPVWIDEGPTTRLGADVWASVDIRCDRDGACAASPATSWLADPTKVDEALRRAAAREEARAAAWAEPEPPEDPSSRPEGDPGSGWQADRWLELAERQWRAGAVNDAIHTTTRAVVAGRDRCEPWMVLGERLLRAGGRREGDVLSVPLDAVAVLDRAVTQLELWETRTEGYTLEQPASCRQARGLLDEARLAADQPPQGPVARAVVALRTDRCEEASQLLRRSLHEQAEADPTGLALLGLADARCGRPLPARATLEMLSRHPGAQTLPHAVLAGRIAATLDPHDNGAQALAAAAQSPAWQAVASAHGAPLELPPLEASLARRPADPTLWALVALRGSQVPEAFPPSADAAVVEVLSAQRVGDLDALAVAWGTLRDSWPLIAIAPTPPPAPMDAIDAPRGPTDLEAP